MEFNPEVSPPEIERIVYESLYEWLKSSGKPEKFLDEAQRAEAKFLGKPVMAFRLTSTMSVATPFFFKKLKVGDADFRFWKTIPKRYVRAYAEQRFEEKTPFELPKGYAGVGITVRARTSGGAAHKALEAYEFLRGVLNFVVGRGRTTYSFGGFYFGPLGLILAGPIHTMHKTSGAKVHDTFYCENSYVAQAKPYQWKPKEQNAFRNETVVILNRVGKARYADKLWKAFVRYGGALQKTQVDETFLALWGVLELLTGVEAGAHKATATRAAVLWDEEKYVLEELTYFRLSRNGMVHDGRQHEDAQVLANEVKKYVEQLFYVLIDPSFLKLAWGEITEILSKTSDVKMLRQQLKVIKTAIQFHS